MSRSCSKPDRSSACSLGRDCCVVEGCTPVGGALEHRERRDVADDGGDDLHAARRGPDDCDSFAGEVDGRRGPQAGVIRLTPEVLSSGDVGRVRHRQDACRGAHVAGADLAPVTRRDGPAARGVVVVGPGHAGAEAHETTQAEAVNDMVEVPLRLGLRCEVFLPFPLVEEVLGEQIAVRVALRIEPGPGVSVPVPGASHAAARLEEQHRKSLLARHVELVDPRDAGTDDEHVDTVGRGGSGSAGCRLGGGVHVDAGPCRRRV